MSQPLSNLSEGTLFSITETINGSVFTVPMLIIANNKSHANPYGSDATLCVRYRGTGKAGTGKTQDGVCNYRDDGSCDYNGSGLDNYLQNEWLNRLDSNTKSCIMTSTIICYNPNDYSVYTLARKAFALSNKELGGSFSSDKSINPGYFTSNASRRTYNSTGATQLNIWTRSPLTEQRVCFINGTASGGGGLMDQSLISDKGSVNKPQNPVRPACNFYSSTLVSDEPDETTGAYTLLPDESHPYRVLSFESKIGDVSEMPVKAMPIFAYTCNNGEMSVKICNNYNDEAPFWEDAEEGASHAFSNNTKTADSWAIGIKINARSENTIYVYEPAALVLTDSGGEQ